jgi:hypothetical protein
MLLGRSSLRKAKQFWAKQLALERMGANVRFLDRGGLNQAADHERRAL